MEAVQNKTIRLITGAFWSTSIERVRLRVFLSPTQLRIWKIAQQVVTRLHKPPNLSPVTQRLPDIWKKPELYAPFSILCKSGSNVYNTTEINLLQPLAHLALATFHLDHGSYSSSPSDFVDRKAVCSPREIPKTVETMNKSLKESRGKPELLMVYCDGSKGERAGYGLVVYHRGERIFQTSVGLDPRNTSFDAEMMALARAAMEARRLVDLKRFRTVKEIRFHSDSTSALKAIDDPSTRPAHFASVLWKNCVEEMRDSHPDLSITVHWSPAHKGILGNEHADSLAKGGTKKPL